LEEPPLSSEQEAIALVRGLDNIELPKFRVVGGIVRFEQSARNSMKDTKQRIVSSLSSQPFGCDNYLIWAPPGSGKSFFIQEIARSMDDHVLYRELNLAQMSEQDFRRALSEIERLDKPRLCFIDEVDSKPTESWPYEALLPSLEPPANRKTVRTCFILAGSSKNSLSGMKENIAKRPKGTDLLSRIPPGNEFVIEGLGLGDRLLVVSTQFLNAAKEYGRQIDEVEKLVLYYVALNPKLKSARQIRQLAVRCVERMPVGEERIKFDYLFDAGDPENKEFWHKAGSLRNEFVNTFVRLEDDQVVVRAPSAKPEISSFYPKETTSGKNRIAVLPFANISPDPKDEYFADGMTEELISTLSKIRGFKVISRTSVLRYKQSNKTLSEIAKELNVGAILEGSVRKAADDLRITAQLIDVDNDEHLWSQDYNRKFENVFSLQAEIAQKVADSLQVTILSKESKELGKKPTKNMEAYILYLKGHTYSNQFTLESFKKMIDYWEHAIQKDPNYAQVYASIASAYSSAGSGELLPTNEAFTKAERFAEKAMQLDPSIPESHIALGWVLLSQRWDFLGAEREMRRALELNPNLVDGHLDLGALLVGLGRFEEAAVECKRALELDPLSTSTCVWAGSGLTSSHHYDEAIEVLRNAIELEPNSGMARNNLGVAYVKKGMIEEGIAEIKIAIEISKGNVANWISDLAYAYARAGNINEVRKILADLLKINEESHKSETEIAGVYLSLGEKDKAIEWLEKAYDRRAGYLLGIIFDSSFDGFRSDPRFQALLKKIGFPDAG
jgi:TolB-like protein/Tfp pilus assembly protein PilF